MAAVPIRKVEMPPFGCSIEYFAHPEASIEDTQGFFSFSYYLSDTTTVFEKQGAPIYLFGLMSYLYLCHHFEAFHNWKLVIYTDKQTYEFIQTQQKAGANANLPLPPALTTIEIQGYNAQIANFETDTNVYNFIKEHPPFSPTPHPIRYASSYRDLYEPYMIINSGRRETYAFQTNLLYYALLQDPKVFWAIVDWPEKSTGPELQKIHGPVLRCFRFRSPFDFPKAFHFIRDADTLHETYFKRHMPRLYIHSLAYALFLHESQGFAFMQKKQLEQSKPLFVLGTLKRSYVRNWHYDNVYGAATKPSVGFLAGYVNISPNVPCLTAEIWTQCLEYIDQRVKKLANNTFSNKDKGKVQYGRDEQILLYVLGPACLDSFMIVKVIMYGDPNPGGHLTHFHGLSQFLNKTPVINVYRNEKNQVEGMGESEIMALYLTSDYVKRPNGSYTYKSLFEIKEDPEKEALYRANVEKWKAIRVGGRRLKTRRMLKKRSHTYKKK